MKETNVGSQIQKNIFEGLSMKGTYDFEGGLKGSDLAQRIHDTVSKLSNLGKADLKEKYGIDENNIIKDKQFIYNALIEEFQDRGGNENIVTALQKNMPFDAIPQIRGKVESIFMSIMNKKLTKISTEGGSFIQVSPFGIETMKKDGDNGILIVSEDYNEEALLPPRIENKKVLPGQAMIPHSQAVKLLKKHGITLDGKDMKSAIALLDPSALEMITYRIPNQGMSSNDYLQIVGILPPGMGDSIVVYDGLPAKTGSDFDIDKLFAMQNNVVFDTETGKVSKLTEANKHLAVDKKGNPLSEAEIDKLLTQNELVAQYKAVLNSPLTYDAMMRSIDGAQLKDDIAGTRDNPEKGLFPAPVMGNMELFSPLTQLKTKSEYLSGKMGVGQTANHLVDHVMNQMLNVRLPLYIGIGNKQQEKITSGKKKGEYKDVTFFDSATTGTHSIADNLSAFLNAYVDIAKDPYIARGNHNSITANTTFMLLRAGVPMKWVNRFIGQPILKELVELQMEQKSITADDIKLKGNKEGETHKGSPMEAILQKYDFDKSRFTKASLAEIMPHMTEKMLEDNIRGERNEGLDFHVLAAWNFLQEQGKIFGDSVIAAKSDTAGAGGSNIDRLVNSNKIKKILSEGNIKGYETKFAGTMLGTYKENTLDWINEVVQSSDLFLSGTRQAQDMFDVVSFQTANGKILTDSKLGKSIDNAFYSYVMSGTRMFEGNNKDYKRITTEVPNEVFDRQEAISKGDAKSNFLLEELEIQTRKGKRYLGINNKDKPTQYQNDIYRGWMDLYETYNYTADGKLDTTSDHPDRQLALDLVKYAFTASGFQNNLSQFFTHIPHQILTDNNISGDIRDAIKDIEKIASDGLFVDQFQRHSKENSKVVKSLNVSSMETDKNSNSVFIYTPAKNKSQELGSVDNNIRFFPKFVNGRISTYNQATGWTTVKNFLYEKQGTVNRRDADGDMIPVPVYARTFELGSSEGKFKTVEYSSEVALTESHIEGNNVPANIKVFVNEGMKKVRLEKSLKDLKGAEVNQVMIDAIQEKEASDLQVIQANLTQIIKDKKIQCK
ncbi:MAG: hypothetical protein KUG81_07605 [Gammaproteobacteria bacterium]|nr:hypothetical protein [Gammaproteobacteria bacterium]